MTFMFTIVLSLIRFHIVHVCNIHYIHANKKCKTRASSHENNIDVTGVKIEQVRGSVTRSAGPFDYVNYIYYLPVITTWNAYKPLNRWPTILGQQFTREWTHQYNTHKRHVGQLERGIFSRQLTLKKQRSNPPFSSHAFLIVSRD